MSEGAWRKVNTFFSSGVMDNHNNVKHPPMLSFCNTDVKYGVTYENIIVCYSPGG